MTDNNPQIKLGRWFAISAAIALTFGSLSPVGVAAMQQVNEASVTAVTTAPKSWRNAQFSCGMSKRVS